MMWDQKALKRASRLIEETVVGRLGLDLTGTCVVTEAATGPFALTATIAAMAGATVEAISADSPYGSSCDAAEATLEVACACGVADKIKIVSRNSAAYEKADIVTNLGFVRPVDADVVLRLRRGSVIPLMYDVREIRDSEIDVSLCHARGVSVVGTNEDHPLVDVLRYSGQLVVKMLLEHGIEILRSRILILGDNLFTPNIGRELHSLGAELYLCRNWDECEAATGLDIDALIYIDYWNKSGEINFAGKDAWLSKHAEAAIIQFVGGLDISPFATAGWRVIPERAVPAQRMWRTLADLGLRPVVELNAAGLKAAELELRGVPHGSSGRLCGLRQRVIGMPAPSPVAAESPVLV